MVRSRVLMTALWLGFGVAVSAVGGCLDTGDPIFDRRPVSPVPSGPLDYATHIEPILADYNCALCHPAGGSTNGLDATSAETLQRGGLTGPAITPCDSEGSLVYQYVRDCFMPATSRCLADEEVQTIAKWIDQGAGATYVAGVCQDPPLD